MNFFKSIKNFFTGEVNHMEPTPAVTFESMAVGMLKQMVVLECNGGLLLHVPGPCIMCPSASAV